MIIQLGSIFGSIISGLGTSLGGALRQLAPSAIQLGQQFLQKEINRKLFSQQRRQVQAQAVQALNTPGIAVARLGGTTQPVGGLVQRPTFTSAALAPAQNPGGNIPLLPVGGFPRAVRDFATGPFVSGINGFRRSATVPVTTNGLLFRKATGPAGAPGEPRYARDENGKTILFVPDPKGQGFLTLKEARAMNISPMRPFWRWNRIESQFEKIKPRRLNPFNFRATSRAGRRVERSLDAVKELVRIQRKMTTGKIRLRVKKRKK